MKLAHAVPRPGRCREALQLIPRRVIGLPMLVALVVCACVKHGASGTIGAQELDASVAHGRDVLTAPELEGQPTVRRATAHDAIGRLRPEFMRANVVEGGQLTFVTPSVFVNGAFHGGVESLRSIPVPVIVEVRFLRPPESRRRFGRDHAAGAILVTTENPRQGTR
jgi:hypothetical protein